MIQITTKAIDPNAKTGYRRPIRRISLEDIEMENTNKEKKIKRRGRS